MYLLCLHAANPYRPAAPHGGQLAPARSTPHEHTTPMQQAAHAHRAGKATPCTRTHHRHDAQAHVHRTRPAAATTAPSSAPPTSQPRVLRTASVRPCTAPRHTRLCTHPRTHPRPRTTGGAAARTNRNPVRPVPPKPPSTRPAAQPVPPRGATSQHVSIRGFCGRNGQAKQEGLARDTRGHRHVRTHNLRIPAAQRPRGFPRQRRTCAYAGVRNDIHALQNGLCPDA
jgi:hypothetical protein